MDMSRYNASIRNIAIPVRMSRLPISDEGFPVPFFVARVNDKWDFRAIGPNKMIDAYNNKKCWLCGERLGTYLAFVIGPMCSVNMINSEPPSHLECAQYAVQACPFLSRPRMRRNEVDLPGGTIAGEHLDHNPGTMAIWITKSYRPFAVRGGTLFKLGEPCNVLWYHEGRSATRGEVLEAMYKGLPFLRKMAAREGRAAVKEVEDSLLRALNRIPKEEPNAGSVRQCEPDRQSVGSGSEDTEGDRGTTS